jgi:hypothetical protein
MADVKTTGVKVRQIFVTAGSVLAIFIPIWFAAAALGTKFGLWTWQVGLVKMTGGIGVPLIGLLMLVTFITSLLIVFIKPRAGYGGLAGMWFVSLAAAGIALSAIGPAKALPPIHDISTDTGRPLSFSAKVLADRGKNSNRILLPTEAPFPFDPKKLTPLSGRPLMMIQTEGYPAMKPLLIKGQVPASIFTKALSTAKSQGIKVTSQDPTALRIEGYSESFWFGFKDDVVIAITPLGNDARVDMRSVSRVGTSDLGANAKRIEAYLAALKG